MRASDPAGAEPSTGVPDRATPYLAFLLVYLSLSAFFDYFATSFRFTMTTYVRQDFGLEFHAFARLLSWVYVGSCLAFVPRALADVWGRRPLLWVTITGLCVFQWLLAFTRTPAEYVLALAILAAFYKADIWTLVISEEAPPARRGFYVGVTIACGITGAMAVGELVHRMGPSHDAWRNVARFPIWGVIAIAPFALVMKETRHFRQLRRRASGRWNARLLIAPFRDDLRRPMVVLIVVQTLFVGVATSGMLLMGSEFLRVDNGLASKQLGRVVQLEVISGIAAALSAGLLADRLGRRRALWLFGLFAATALAALSHLPKGSAMLIGAYLGQAFALPAFYTVLKIATSELFPSECRSTAGGWADLIMTLAAAATAQVIARLTHHAPGAPGSAMPLSSVLLLLSGVVLLSLPPIALLRETKGRRLDEIVA